jgi:predicted ATPase
MLGYPDRAYERAINAIMLARKMNHPYSLSYALFHNGLLNLWLKNYESVQESAQSLLKLAEQHGFQIWSAVGTCLYGAALVGLGSTQQGLVLIEQGLNAYRGLKTPPVFWPMLLQLCAGAYSMASKPEDGLILMNEAIEAASTGTGKTLISEFLILKGELLLALSSENAAEAEALYQQAINNAREVHAPMLELRVAIRLSRLWQAQGKTEQARNLLNDAYAKITEGFTTSDLKEAGDLLTATT